MEKIGAQELVVPDLHPIEIWQSAHRDKKFGASMMRVTDRNNAQFTLGATAEVVMVDLVKQFNISYKDLPINIFQFSKKFRDEARPSGGLLRTREFVMKDGYSFHQDEADLKKTYQKYWDAYLAIAKALDLSVVTVESDNGAIGGSISHEFMVKTDVGEDTIATCSCGYAANLETAEFDRGDINLAEPELPFKIVDQPEWVMTMEDDIKHYKRPKSHFLKNVVYKDSDGQLIIATIRGDLSVSKAKLAKVYGAKGDLEPATDQDLKKLGTKSGWVHCWGHKAVYVGDISLKTVKNFIGGQKEKTTDSINVNYGRDFTCQIEGDIAEAQSDFICSQCHKNKLKLVKAVEFGNIFNIGHVYTKPMIGNFTDIDGQEKPLYMGSYGIGLGRAMACVVETHHDDLGIIWPKSIAPYQVHLINLAADSSAANDLYQQLLTKDIEVLYDDRTEISAGQKFADADLIGIPQRIVISNKTIDQKSVEFKDRFSAKTELVPLEQAISHIYT